MKYMDYSHIWMDSRLVPTYAVKSMVIILLFMGIRYLMIYLILCNIFGHVQV